MKTHSEGVMKESLNKDKLVSQLSNYNLPYFVLLKVAKECNSELIKKGKFKQEARLVELGCNDMLNTSMGIFCLKNNHGYKDKQDITTNDKDINTPLPNVSHLTTQQLQELHDKFTNSESN